MVDQIDFQYMKMFAFDIHEAQVIKSGMHMIYMRLQGASSWNCPYIFLKIIREKFDSRDPITPTQINCTVLKECQRKISIALHFFVGRQGTQQWNRR
ncbi:hypothetical protein AAZX31_11G019300 [Glycine max]|uniref:Uncharacterized protein n=2 Tax=Glycine max TaxID=3847 RepID=K7LML6_SOYBN|nr:hypothetical protein GYH30_029763 [Glycine max]KRH27865.1 hypothetical protein GLYMA_11G019600v4 [Glycine max]